MFNEISSEAWCDYYRPILKLLAKRKNINYDNWILWTNWATVYCLLCDNKIPNGYNELNRVRSHGFNHLKELNLLPFI